MIKDRCEEFSIFTTTQNYYRYYNKPRQSGWNCIEFNDYRYIIDNKIDISHISFSPKNQKIEIINKEAGKFNTLLAMNNAIPELKQHAIPILGICAGQNNIARALDGSTYKIPNPEKHNRIFVEFIKTCKK